VEGGPQGGFIGVLMLDTKFPRPPGDIGHPDSLGLPVRHTVVKGAWPSSVVASADTLRASGLPQAFLDSARQLEQMGARAITTSCGFLVLLQRELQDALTIPVMTSSLLELPRLLEGEAQVGVLTISAAHLGAEHLLAAGVPAGRLHDVIVQGVDPAGEFACAILGNLEAMDVALAQADVIDAARRLQMRAPGLRTVVLECTNMPPYAQAIGVATGWRVRSLLDHFSMRSPSPAR
jgi:hypothetical protein